jgi:hypothetical protein
VRPLNYASVKFCVIIFLAITKCAFAADAVDIAAQQIGKQYSLGDEGPNTFDCSGLVHYSYAQVGITLPRLSLDQSRQAGTQVDGSNLDTVSLRRGDLVFFDMEKPTRGGAPVVNHVGIYQGNGIMINAMSEQLGIGLGHLDRQYWKDRFVSARRIVASPPQQNYVVNPGDIVSATFRFTTPYVGEARYFFGFVSGQVISPSTYSSRLYRGATLLGTANTTDPALINAIYTAPVPGFVCGLGCADLTTLQSGTSDGRVEVTLLTGKFTLNIQNLAVSLAGLTPQVRATIKSISLNGVNVYSAP